MTTRLKFLTYAGLEPKGIRYSKPQLWRLIKAGKFPAPVKDMAKENVWAEHEIDAYVEAKMAERGASKAA
jgi:prophage regulatory protein